MLIEVDKDKVLIMIDSCTFSPTFEELRQINGIVAREVMASGYVEPEPPKRTA